jgi:RNA polymerase sigma-70 factor, ECF subfamily
VDRCGTLIDLGPAFLDKPNLGCLRTWHCRDLGVKERHLSMAKGTDQNNRPQVYSPPRLRVLDDLELVRALCDGCNDALAILFERHSPLVFHIARMIVKDEGEAEETVQQVFFDLFRAIGQFKPERGSFKTWMLQFAYHRSINRREHLLSNKFYNSQELDEAICGDVLSGARSLQNLSPQEAARFIEQVLATLKPAQRRVIQLTYFEGFTAEEIAATSGETAAVVRHHLYRGLSKLRCILQEGGQVKQPVSVKREGEQEGILVAHPRTL